MEYNFINWSEVSRFLANDNRSVIRSDYSRKKYKRQVNGLKRLIAFWTKWAKY